MKTNLSSTSIFFVRTAMGLSSLTGVARAQDVGEALKPWLPRVMKIARDISGQENPSDPVLIIAQDRYAKAQRGIDPAYKRDVDAAARAEHNSEFETPDFPYHDRTNDCGPGEGEVNTAVPERSTLVPGGPLYTPACNKHDRAYMTLGRTRDDSDDAILADLNKIIDEWLAESVEQWLPVQREVKKLAERWVTVKKKEFFSRRIQVPRLKKIKKFGVVVAVVPDVTSEIVREFRWVDKRVKQTFETTAIETYMVREFLPRSKVVDRAFEPILRGEVRGYYTAIRELGGKGSHANSQRQERIYQEWLLRYELENGLR